MLSQHSTLCCRTQVVINTYPSASKCCQAIMRGDQSKKETTQAMAIIIPTCLPVRQAL